MENHTHNVIFGVQLFWDKSSIIHVPEQINFLPELWQEFCGSIAWGLFGHFS